MADVHRVFAFLLAVQALTSGCMQNIGKVESLDILNYEPLAYLQSENSADQEYTDQIADRLRGENIGFIIDDLTAKIEFPNDNFKKSELYLLRGICHFKQDKFDESISDYSESIKLNSNDWRPLFHRWQAYQAVGEVEKASFDRERGRKLKKSIFSKTYALNGGVI